ncbi:hypothetical protein [Petropleomorpha daqingensis]|uniref:Uncharacterized protein n=1 Tax=Petropleomorpha daqingensis TaxID=2026353 RepID=A0A853CH70_9ACTN|nr:hypothetical protein [Petropleomorpha daqingensis]NYJ07305.1 hypothetical protein [Petropleomorpha daqingensis]
MTSISAPPAYTSPAPRRRGAARVVALVLGSLLLLPGIALVAAGGLLLWAHGVHRSDGFVFSPEDRLSTSTHALFSDRIDLRTGADWLPVSTSIGDARVQVTADDRGAVFVGVARADDVNAYLHGVSRTHVDALGFDSPAGTDDQFPGGAPSGPPADQDFWIARSSGTGTQQVAWPAGDGDWVFVVMNADGSAGVDVDGRIGAEFPALGTVAWTVLIVGAGITVVGVLLVRPRRQGF